MAPKTAQECEQLAREYYNKQDYKKAISIISEGLHATNDPHLRLLDLRAGLQIKSGDLDAALRDARSMIKSQCTSVKGYLRAGQVLQKMDKVERALDIYQYGIRNVPITDKDYDLLRSMRDKLQRQLAPDRSLDPLTVFPVEIAEMLLHYLTFAERVQCLRVSGSWFRFLVARPLLWTKVDLSDAKRLVPGKFLRSCTTRANGKITELILHRTHDIDILRPVVTKCQRHLRTLQLKEVGSIGQTLIDVVRCAAGLQELTVAGDIGPDILHQLASARPTLRHLQCYNVRRATRSLFAPDRVTHQMRDLRILDLRGSTKDNSSALMTIDLNSLLGPDSKLEQLTLSGIVCRFDLRGFPSLQSLSIRRQRFLPLALPLGLQRIEFAQVHFIKPDGPWQPFHLFHSNQKLSLARAENFALTACNLPSVWEGFVDLVNAQEIQGEPMLRSLNLNNSYLVNDVTVTPSGLVGLLSCPIMRNLESLLLAESPITDKEVQQLDVMLPKLLSLDLSRTKITGVSVKHIIKSLPKLWWLGLDDCQHVSSDAIEWARNHGVTIKRKMGQHAKATGSRPLRNQW